MNQAEGVFLRVIYANCVFLKQFLNPRTGLVKRVSSRQVTFDAQCVPVQGRNR